jgi:preprotein translocase subunit SecA
MKLVQDSKLLYQDNETKENEIKKTVAEMYDKFIKTFGTDTILTTNKHADDIIGAFNEEEEIDITNKNSSHLELKFFHVKELDNNYSNFLENSLGGFASHSEEYDVAVIFDKEKGLYAIPFYETFSKIFTDANIEGKDNCIKYFLTNETIPNTIIERIASKNKNFMDIVNATLEKEYSFVELMQEYKSEYLNNQIYSSATVLYCSNAFSQVFDDISAPKPETKTFSSEKVGRNEPCPCGSGKKYKNCCGNA